MALGDWSSFFGKSPHTSESRAALRALSCPDPCPHERTCGSVITPGIGLLGSVHSYSWYPNASGLYLQTLKKCSNIRRFIIYLSIYLGIFSILWTTKDLFITTFSSPWTVKRALKTKHNPSIFVFSVFVIFLPLLGKPSNLQVLVSQTIPTQQPLAHSCFCEGNTDQLSCPVAVLMCVVLSSTLSVLLYTLQMLQGHVRANAGNSGFPPGPVSLGPLGKQAVLFWAWHAVTNGKREIRDRQFSSAVWRITRCVLLKWRES